MMMKQKKEIERGKNQTAEGTRLIARAREWMIKRSDRWTERRWQLK